jgi:hypothetical protein
MNESRHTKSPPCVNFFLLPDIMPAQNANFGSGTDFLPVYAE